MMRSTVAFLLFGLGTFAPNVIAHGGRTICYNYFLKKDKCVYGSGIESERCPYPPKNSEGPVPAFDLVQQQPQQQSFGKRSKEHTLDARYDTTQPSFAVAGGDGICNFYNSTKELGVCLWSGPEQVNPTPKTAGWLNGPNHKNCRKQVYIQRKGRPDTVKFVPILDGCSFNTQDPETGCFQIALTLALFDAFNPTPAERASGTITGGITWDYNNLRGDKPENAPGR